MEDIKKLYPLKFLPIAEPFQWGGSELNRRYAKSFIVCDDKGREKKLAPGSAVAESVEIADLGYRDSQVREGWLAGNSMSELMDMYLDRLVGEDPFGFYGRQFPVGAKFIDATGRMPLMVCPDDTLAQDKYDFLGKTKMWYIVDAKPGSKLYLGFRRDLNASEFYEGCLSGDVERFLNVITPKKGEHYLIAPGEVHAASDGVLILEVSEASPLDFCLTGWGEPLPEGEFDETLNLIEALEFINFRHHAAAETVEGEKLADVEQFTATLMKLDNPLHVTGAQYGCFAFYTCAEGEFAVQVPEDKEKMESYVVKAGESILVPAEVEEYYLSPRTLGTVLVEVTLPQRIEKDFNIDPSVAAKLPEDE